MIKYFFISILFFFICCIQKNNTSKLNKNELVDSLTELLGTENYDSVGKAWTKEILSDKNNLIRILIFDSLNAKDNNYELKKKVFYSKRIENQVNLHCLEVCLKKSDSVYVDGSPVKKEYVLKEIGNSINYRLENVLLDDCYLHHIFSINDSVKPCFCIEIGLNLYSDEIENNNSVDWSEYFNIISETIHVLQKKRNEISLKKYQTQFKFLEAEKKKDILRFTSIRILLNFDMSYCSKVITP